MAPAHSRPSFLGLPAELRVLVYEYAFATEVDISAAVEYLPTPHESSKLPKRKRGWTPREIDQHIAPAMNPRWLENYPVSNAGLLVTCKTTRNECYELYWQLITFVALSDRQVMEFLRCCPTDDRDLITNIHMDYDLPTPCEIFVQAELLSAGLFLASLTINLRRKYEIKMEKGVLKVSLLSWTGEGNEYIWTSEPVNVSPPRLSLDLDIESEED